MKSLILLIVFFCSATVNAQILDDVRELTELNDPNFTDAYPYLTDDGLRLYFTNNDGGNNNLYFSSRPDLLSDFEPKQLLDSTLFSGVVSCWFTNDELKAYYSNGTFLSHVSRATTASAFGTPTVINLVGGTGGFLGGQSFTPGGEELYFYNADEIAKYEYTNSSTYTFVSNLAIPAGYTTSTAQLSKDGLELFWALSPIGVDSSYLFKADRAAIGDDFLNPIIMNDQINPPTFLHSSHASYAAGPNILVWVHNNGLTWNGNDLYIAQSSTSSLTELSNGPKELVKIVDLMGRETNYEPRKALIYIYSDGSTEKVVGFED